MITVQNVTPQMSAYFPDRRVRGFQGDEFRAPSFQDSLRLWVDRNIIVAPKEVPVAGRRVIETHHYVVYAPPVSP
jgi:hypothetical protein